MDIKNLESMCVEKLYKEREEIVSFINKLASSLGFEDYDGRYFDGWDYVTDYDNSVYNDCLEDFEKTYENDFKRIEEIDTYLKLINKYDKSRISSCFMMDFTYEINYR